MKAITIQTFKLTGSVNRMMRANSETAAIENFNVCWNAFGKDSFKESHKNINFPPSRGHIGSKLKIRIIKLYCIKIVKTYSDIKLSSKRKKAPAINHTCCIGPANVTIASSFNGRFPCSSISATPPKGRKDIFFNLHEKKEAATACPNS